MITMKKDKGKTYMIIGIIILVLAIIGSTYAYYKYVFVRVNVDTITRGLDYYITYAKGTDITNKVLEPSTDYTGGNSVTVTLYKKDNTYDIYGQIYLNVTSIGTALSNSSALRYVVTDGTNVVTSGNLKGIAAGSKIPLAVNIPLNTTSTEYTVYLWFNYNISEETSSEGQTISASVSCEASMKELDISNYYIGTGNSAKFITDLFTPTTTVVNNGITYEYDTNHKLMKDSNGNIRFYGASPNNYIYFNCESYPDGDCEVWRIIGVFDGKVKIIREKKFVASFDNRDTSTGVESNDGDNDWTTSRLMKLLNPGYESESIGGSLYWNAGSGSYYVEPNNNVWNFDEVGLKNNATRNLTTTSTWYLGGTDNLIGFYSNDLYEIERGTNVYSERATSWYGNVALPYASDYGFAEDFMKCNLPLDEYHNNVCYENNWMILANGDAFMLNPYIGDSFEVLAFSGGQFGAMRAAEPFPIYPTLYLNLDIEFIGGDGGITPYILKVE